MILQIDSNAVIVNRFDNLDEVDGVRKHDVSRVLNGERNRAGGYFWLTKTDGRTTPICKVNRNGKVVKVYSKIREVVPETGLREEILSMHVRGKAHMKGLNGYVYRKLV